MKIVALREVFTAFSDRLLQGGRHSYYLFDIVIPFLASTAVILLISTIIQSSYSLTMIVVISNSGWYVWRALRPGKMSESLSKQILAQVIAGVILFIIFAFISKEGLVKAFPIFLTDGIRYIFLTVAIFLWLYAAVEIGKKLTIENSHVSLKKKYKRGDSVIIELAMKTRYTLKGGYLDCIIIAPNGVIVHETTTYSRGTKPNIQGLLFGKKEGDTQFPSWQIPDNALIGPYEVQLSLFDFRQDYSFQKKWVRLKRWNDSFEVE